MSLVACVCAQNEEPKTNPVRPTQGFRKQSPTCSDQGVALNEGTLNPWQQAIEKASHYHQLINSSDELVIGAA